MRQPKRIITGNFCYYDKVQEKKFNSFGLPICDLYQSLSKQKDSICARCGQKPVTIAVYDSKLNYISQNKKRLWIVFLIHLRLTDIRGEKNLIKYLQPRFNYRGI